MKKSYRWVLAAIVLLLFISRNLVADVYLDLLWFRELGHRAVYSKILITQLLLGAAFASGFFVLVYANLWIARRWAPPIPRIMDDLGFRERAGSAARRSFDLIILASAAVAALLAGWIAATQWQSFLLFSHAMPFGVRDPLFQRDVGFYVFRLPFITGLYQWLFFTVFVALLGTAGVHYFDRALTVVTGIPRFAPHVKVHLSILVALLLALRGWGFALDAYGLLYSTAGYVFGAGYTDVHARLMAMRVMEVLCFVGAIAVLVSIRLRGITVPTAALGGLVAVWLVLGVLYPGFVQQFRVAPQESTMELPYIKRSIDFTRAAYGLDKAEVRSFSARAALTGEALQRNRATVSNIRLWDYEQLKNLYKQQQALRQFYTFQDVDVDRYTLQGRLRQVMLSARELEKDRVVQSWIGQKLQYTHGYGAVMSPVNAKTEEGNPLYLMSDIPIQSPAPLRLKHPEIYFGETTNDYVIVNTRQREYDYPSGDQENYGRYRGRAGVPVGGFWRRLLFTLRFGDQNFMLSQELSPSSRVLFRRSIQERLGRLAPFLSLDRDPYLVVSDGRLVWIQDAYTTTERYPYSKPYDAVSGTNYIRNSVKAVTDAYDGTVTLYVSDPSDPLVRSYAAIFPGLFTPISQAPADLSRHFRYPEGLFRVQTEMYGLYHMLDPNDFYLKTDAWDVASTRRNEETVEMDPYYLVMSLPGEQNPGFMLIRPFVVRNKDNMAGWVAALSDQPDYGRLVVFRFPKSVLTLGPSQIESRFNNDPEISRQLTLWNQQGSSVIRGNLMVIPVESSLLYVQPLYIQARTATAEVPQLRKVLVAAENPPNVVMADTLDQALSGLLETAVTVDTGAFAPAGQPSGGGASPTAPGPPGAAPPDVSRMVRQADEQLRAAEQAQRAGDWARYGEQIRALRRTLQQLSQRTGAGGGTTAP